jgi:tetratricopeptide (TPR) repeat protein
MQIPEDITAHNEARFAELDTSLNQEKAQTIIAVVDQRAARTQILEAAISVNPALQPVLLDLSKTKVESLIQSIDEKIPPELLEAEDLFAVVHSVNLEGTLLTERLAGEAPLLTQLGEESEELTGKYAFHLVLWIDAFLFGELEKTSHPLLQAVDQVLHFFSGKPEGAEDYEKIAALQQEIDAAEDPGTLASQFAAVGTILQKAFRQQEAMIYFEKALEAAQVSQDERALAESYLGIGHLLMEDKDMVQALDNYEIALEKYEELEDQAQLAIVHERIARLKSQLVGYAEAIRHQAQSLRIYQDLEDQEEIGINARRLAYFYERKGEPARAAECYELAAETYGKLDEAAEVARSWQQIGAIHQGRFEWEQALAAFEKALPAARETGDEYLIHAVEDSVEDIKEKMPKAKKAKNSAEGGKKKGLFGKLFGK